MSKLPEITLAFWMMKICATIPGETAGDLLSMPPAGVNVVPWENTPGPSKRALVL